MDVGKVVATPSCEGWGLLFLVVLTLLLLHQWLRCWCQNSFTAQGQGTTATRRAAVCSDCMREGERECVRVFGTVREPQKPRETQP